MPGTDANFRDLQYYALLEERLRTQHATSKTAYGTYCSCTECTHSWRGECMESKCACCTSPWKE